MKDKGLVLRERKRPIDSGIHRKLITRNYVMGNAYMLKDSNCFYDIDKIEIVTKELAFK